MAILIYVVGLLVSFVVGIKYIKSIGRTINEDVILTVLFLSFFWPGLLTALIIFIPLSFLLKGLKYFVDKWL